MLEASMIQESEAVFLDLLSNEDLELIKSQKNYVNNRSPSKPISKR
jgi:hypothetical protein